jgi:hypothetical protein
VDTIDLSDLEIEQVLCHVLETLMVYDYPTPAIFSSLTRLGIVSFLRGKGIQTSIEIMSIDVFRQFSEFTQSNKKYEWFTLWSQRLVESVKEKRTEDDGLL